MQARTPEAKRFCHLLVANRTVLEHGGDVVTREVERWRTSEVARWREEETSQTQ
jgi:hypothetical protein